MRPTLSAAVVAILLIAFAAGTAALRAQTPVLHIPVLLSLTGQAAFVGKGEQQDLTLIEEIVNRRGGINGRQISFDIQDDASNTQTTLQLANGILAGKPPLMIGPTLTQDCNAMAPLVKDNGPVEWCLSPAIAAGPGGYIFSSSVGARDLVAAQLRYFRERGLKRIAVLSSTDATGQSFDNMMTVVKALPENKDVTLVAYEHFNLADVSVAAQISRIKAASPQAIMTFTIGPPFGTELRAISDAGLNIPVSGSNGDMTYVQMAQYKSIMPKDLEFAAVLPSSHMDLGDRRIRSAQSDYFEAFKSINVRPDFPNTLAWDPALIMLDVYRKLGFTPTIAQVKAYLDNLHDWVGINGPYDFRNGDRRGLGLNLTVVSRWDVDKGDFVTASGRGGALISPSK
jgi:branched-chain amino acid transport system substrate-binding protein